MKVERATAGLERNKSKSPPHRKRSQRVASSGEWEAPVLRVHQEAQSLRNLLVRIANGLKQEVGCEVVAIGEILPRRRRVRLIALWLANDGETMEDSTKGRSQSCFAYDEGLQSMAAGDLEAVVYVNTARAPSELARFFHRTGCSTALVVPLFPCQQADENTCPVSPDLEPSSRSESFHILALGLNVALGDLAKSLQAALSFVQLSPPTSVSPAVPSVA
jgi:hypothetical protein